MQSNQVFESLYIAFLERYPEKGEEYILLRKYPQEPIEYVYKQIVRQLVFLRLDASSIEIVRNGGTVTSTTKLPSGKEVGPVTISALGTKN